MKARLSAGVTLELAFAVLLTAYDSEQLESRLLIAFEADHGERPPFNKLAALASVPNPLEVSGRQDRVAQLRDAGGTRRDASNSGGAAGARAAVGPDAG